jgi:multidrug efflux system membrane fusion protein
MTEPQSTAQAAAHHSGFTQTPPSRSRWVLKTLIALGVLALLVVIVRAIEAPKAKRPAPPAIPVVLAPARVGTLDVYLDAIGTVTPVYTDTIVSRVAGMITEVHFKEGQIVKKNDLLAIIDPRPYVAVLEQAQGQLGRDQATLKNARIDLVRYQNSFKVHAIPDAWDCATSIRVTS